MPDLDVTVNELRAGITVSPGVLFIRVRAVRSKTVLLRFSGMFFDTNKNFVMPVSLPSLAKIGEVYEQRPNSTVLIVGHTDTTGDPSYNDKLSLERAESMTAYLRDDVETWLGRYKSSVPSGKRWGSPEDQMMLSAVPRGESAETNPVRAFQDSRGLGIDGIIGADTRQRLIKEYMDRDLTSLPEGCTIQVHGCGEHFPLSGEDGELDESPGDDEIDPLDRRVELLFFDRAIEPAPPGPLSKPTDPQYGEWCKKSEIVFQRTFGPPRQLRVRLRINGKAIVDEPYELSIDGVLRASSKTQKGGLVAQILPDDAKLAEISLPRLEVTRTLELKSVNDFPTAETVEGVQVRLGQLGFHCGPVTGELNEVTNDALAEFRSQNGLGAGAVLDAPTRAKLIEEYGS